MVDYRTYMSEALDKCTHPGMSQNQRQRTFRSLANLWSREKEQIKAMSRSEVRDMVECP